MFTSRGTPLPVDRQVAAFASVLHPITAQRLPSHARIILPARAKRLERLQQSDLTESFTLRGTTTPGMRSCSIARSTLAAHRDKKLSFQRKPSRSTLRSRPSLFGARLFIQ